MADVTTGIKLEASGGETYAKDVEKAVQDTEKLETALENVEEAADKADEAVNGKDGKGGVAEGLSDLETNAMNAATHVMKLVGALANLGSAYIEGTGDFAARAASIASNAETLGVSSEFYQRWSWAIDGTQDSLIGLQSAFDRLNKIKFNVFEASEIWLSDIGLSIEEIQDLSKEDYFEAVISGLLAIEDADERALAASNLFGTAWHKLIPVLGMSSEELEAAKKEIEDYRLLLSDEKLEQAALFTDAQDGVQRTWQGVSDNFYSYGMGAETRFMSGLVDFFNSEFDWSAFESAANAVGDKALAFVEYIFTHGQDIAAYAKLIGEGFAGWAVVSVVKTVVTDLKTAWSLLSAIGAALGISGGAVLTGGGALVAGGVAIAQYTNELETAGRIGSGRSLEEYTANVEALEAAYQAALDKKEQAFNEGWYADAAQMLEYEESIARAAVENAQAELEQARQAAAAVETGQAGTGFPPPNTDAPVQALVESAEAGAEAVEGAVVTGQEGLDAFYTMVDDLNNAESRGLTEIAGSAGTISTEFADGVDEMSQAAADSIQTTNDVLAADMGVLSGNMAVWGSDMMLSFANGMIQGYNTFLLPAIDQVTGEINARFGHSEPEKGPLSDDSTWMPDMMASFAQGIRDNKWLVLDELGALARGMETSFDPTLGMPGGGSSVSYGGVTVIFQVQDGQDGRDLFNEFSVYLENEIAQEEAVFAS